jgi:hypothetical protein
VSARCDYRFVCFRYKARWKVFDVDGVRKLEPLLAVASRLFPKRLRFGRVALSINFQVAHARELFQQERNCRSNCHGRFDSFCWSLSFAIVSIVLFPLDPSALTTSGVL